MKILKLLGGIATLTAITATSYGQTIQAHTISNNNGATGWAMFFDLESLGPDVWITELRTATSSFTGTNFEIEIFTRTGTALGGSAATGPGSSPAGWTSLGTSPGTQGPVNNGISLPIDIPDVAVGAGQVVGVAMLFSGVGPRYNGIGTPPYSVFADANLQLTTGDARSNPFTTGGGYFSSRALVGSITYSTVPEPAPVAALGASILALALARRRK